MKLIVTFHNFVNAPKMGHKGEGSCWLFGVLRIVVMVGVMGLSMRKPERDSKVIQKLQKILRWIFLFKSNCTFIAEYRGWSSAAACRKLPTLTLSVSVRLLSLDWCITHCPCTTVPHAEHHWGGWLFTVYRRRLPSPCQGEFSQFGAMCWSWGSDILR